MDRSLDIEVTRRCNLRCDYCFVGWSRDWSSDLPAEVARQVMAEGAGRFDLLHFTGGEPFARKDLLDLVDFGLARGYPSVLINSNGTLFTPELVARLGAYEGRVMISISQDGPAALHDPVRGPGRWAEADRAIGALLAAGVPVTLMTVVTRPVLDGLSSFLLERHAAHPGLTGITLFPVGVGPSGTQKPGKPLRSLTPADVQRLATVTALARHLGIRVRVGAYPMINMLLEELGYPRAELYTCGAGRGRVCVHADQAVSTCHPVKDPVYGHWRSGLFDEIPGLRAHERMRSRDFAGCRSCEHKEACGHCRAFVTASGQELYGNDEVCLSVVPGRAVALELA